MLAFDHTIKCFQGVKIGTLHIFESLIESMRNHDLVGHRCGVRHLPIYMLQYRNEQRGSKLIQPNVRHRRSNDSDMKLMRAAIAEARAAAREGNAPIGAVIARHNRIIERGHNKVFTLHEITAHAEVVVIRSLTRRIKSFDLKDYELFTTFFPCAMCIATVLRTHIRRVVYGAEAQDAPQFSSGIHQQLNRRVYAIAKSRVSFTGGVLREECARLLYGAKPD